VIFFQVFKKLDENKYTKSADREKWYDKKDEVSHNESSFM
jgi:hypothetical protein